MDNRELDLAIPETRTESLARGNGLDAEEKDESDIKDTLEYVAFAIVHHGHYSRKYTCITVARDMTVQCHAMVEWCFSYLLRLISEMNTPLAWPDPEVEVR